MCKLYCGPQQQELELELELDLDFCLVSCREKKKSNCKSSSTLPPSPVLPPHVSKAFLQHISHSLPAGVNSEQRASTPGLLLWVIHTFVFGGHQTQTPPFIFIFLSLHPLLESLECVDAGVSPRIESLANYQSQFSFSLFLPSEL